MRYRAAIAVAATALAAVALGGSVAAAGPAGGTLGPALRITDVSPLTIAGLRFRANERVTIRLLLDGRTTVRLTRASALGRFRLVLQEESRHPCEGGLLSAAASGARGSRAFLKLPQPLCPPALSSERQP